MTVQDDYTHRSWCHARGIKVYPVTEFEYQERKLLYELNKGTIGKEVFRMKRDSLLAKITKLPLLHIAVERKTSVSIGEMIFFQDKKNEAGQMVQDQIAILYRMIYEKESKKLKATA